MPLEAVDGVIGGADEGHVALLDEAADGQLGVVLELVVAQVPDLLGGVAVQHAVVAEEGVQLQVGPVVHRVAAAQPDLSDVVEAAVLVDLTGRNMAVVIADGHILSVSVVQVLCGGRLEHELLIHKCFHGQNSFFQWS